MPLIEKHILDFGPKVAVCEVRESEQHWGAYMREISDYNRGLFEGITNPKRRMEFLFSRYLLTQLTGDRNVVVSYNESGCPQIAQGHVSISHSGNYIAVAVAEDPVGLDIQTFDMKIGRIAPKFLHEDEWAFIPKEEQIRYQTFIWAAKEALYKLDGQGGLIFKKQLLVDPFGIEESWQVGGVVKREQPRNCNLLMQDARDYALVIAGWNE